MNKTCLQALTLGAAGWAALVPSRTDIALPGGGPLTLAVGDVNGDGKDEIVAGHVPSADATGELRGASVLVKQAGETFHSTLIALTDFEPDRLLLADLDGDGKLDLVALRTLDDGGGHVRILMGHGDGTFSAGSELEDVGTPLAVAAGDVDGDGKVDLVVTSAEGGAPLQVHKGRGDGTFLPPQGHYDVARSSHLAVGDVNGDGKNEVVLGTDDGAVDVLLQDGKGGLLAPVHTDVGEGSVAVALGDVNGDGKPEIVAAADGSPWVSVITAQGASFLQQRFAIDGKASGVAVGDVNGDGKLEIVTIDTEASTLSVLRQTGEGRYALALITSVGEEPVALRLANLHGDGKLDAVTVNEKGGSISVVHFGK